jgi:hypothetical protein
MLNVVMLNVAMQNVAMLNVVMLNVMAPVRKPEFRGSVALLKNID